MKPILSALFWVSVYLLLVLAPLLVLVLGELPSGSGFWWDFSMGLGFAGMALMCIQFLLTARFRRATAPFGLDIIYYFHRYLAVIAFVLISLHYLIIRINNVDALGPINFLEATWYMTSGRMAQTLLALLLITSLWRKPLNIDYDKWRMLHIGLAVSVFLLSLGHIEGVSYYIDAPAKRWLWGGYTMVWLALIFYVRIFKPWFMHNRPYRVVDMRKERGRSWTLVLEPQGHKGITFMPGQFAWLTLRESPWHIKEHPFSFSSSATITDRLEFTIKDRGDFTSTIKDTKVGEVAYLDGPYGVFSVDRYKDAPGFVFIAGGVGAAPIMSMLRTLADRRDNRPLWFIYGSNSLEDVIFLEELKVLKEKLDIRIVHVLDKPEADWKGESGFVTPELLHRVLPFPDEAGKYEYFICGPKPMTDGVLRGLRALNVPLGQTHLELFDLV